MSASKKKYYRIFKNSKEETGVLPVKIKYIPNDMLSDYPDCVDEIAYLTNDGIGDSDNYNMVFWVKASTKSEMDNFKKDEKTKNIIGIYTEDNNIFYSVVN